LRVALGKIFRRQHVWMGIDPEHAEISSVSGIQIGDRGQIDEAVAAERHDPIRAMFLDCCACRPGLLKQGASAKNAVLDFQRLSRLRFGHRDRCHGAARGRSQPGKQFRSQVVVG
jgi:hypothetical protein